MKRFAWFLAVCLLAVAANAEDVVWIKDVGLNFFQSGTVMPLRLAVNNPLRTTLPITLQINIRSDQKLCVPSRFTKTMTLRPLERADVNLPIVYSSCGNDKIDVVVLDAAGRRIGAASTGEKRIEPVAATAVLCSDETVCDEVQKQILLNGTEEERNRKNRNLKFVVLRQPLPQWWSYEPAGTLIVAAPVKGYTSEEKQALERYMLRGGTLITIEDELKDASFLAAFRQEKKLGSERQKVVKGGLFRIPSLRSGELAKLYQGKTLDSMTPDRGLYGPNRYELHDAGWLASRVGPQFEFPKLRWMLLWMSAYIVVLGVVNFTVLRKLKRLEWGWITIAGCSLLFAAWFYFSNYYRGPHIFEGTNVAVFWMDQRSPEAFAEYALAAASPKRTEIKVNVESGAVLQSGEWTGKNDSTQDIYEGITGNRVYGAGWQVALGDPQQVELSMLRWSSRTLAYHDFRTFAGTVHWSGPNKLKNDTGQDFSDAAYVDNKGCSIRSIGPFKAGQELDVTSFPERSFKQDWNCAGNPEEHIRSRDRLLRMPVIEGAAWSMGLGDKGFIGSLDSGTIPVEIDQKGVEWHKAALVVVPLS